MQQAMSLESILESVRKCNKLRPLDPFQNFLSPSRLLGMEIVESPVRVAPVLKLSTDAPVSDIFRVEFDTWLLDMFGTRDNSPIPFGTAVMFGGTVVMRREDIVRLSCA